MGSWVCPPMEQPMPPSLLFPTTIPDLASLCFFMIFQRRWVISPSSTFPKVPETVLLLILGPIPSVHPFILSSICFLGCNSNRSFGVLATCLTISKSLSPLPSLYWVEIENTFYGSFFDVNDVEACENESLKGQVYSLFPTHRRNYGLWETYSF